eukprot:Ihof_evm7s109 gene=Ihof_evmTU7s109
MSMDLFAIYHKNISTQDLENELLTKNPMSSHINKSTTVSTSLPLHQIVILAVGEHHHFSTCNEQHQQQMDHLDEDIAIKNPRNQNHYLPLTTRLSTTYPVGPHKLSQQLTLIAAACPQTMTPYTDSSGILDPKNLKQALGAH